MSATYRCHCRPMSRTRARRGRFQHALRAGNHHPPGRREADHDHRRCACGCYELFAKEIQHRRPWGKSVGVPAHERVPTCSWPAWLACRADPAKDINWATSATVKPIELFKDGKIDAFLGFPPASHRSCTPCKLGHVIVDSSVDRPWSQYLCCVLGRATRISYATTRSRRRRVARHPQGSRPRR